VRLRLAEYFRFVAQIEPFGHPQIQPYELHYSELQQHRGAQIGIAGLNSAWRSTSRKNDASRSDRDRLLMGAGQLRRADLRIALLHHPPDSDWFKAFDRSSGDRMHPIRSAPTRASFG
jgi:hypothetical protein